MLCPALSTVFALRASGLPSYNVSTKTYRSDLVCTTELYIIPIASPNVVVTRSRIIRLILCKMGGSYLFPPLYSGGNKCASSPVAIPRKAFKQAFTQSMLPHDADSGEKAD